MPEALAAPGTSADREGPELQALVPEYAGSTPILGVCKLDLWVSALPAGTEREKRAAPLVVSAPRRQRRDEGGAVCVPLRPLENQPRVTVQLVRGTGCDYRHGLNEAIVIDAV